MDNHYGMFARKMLRVLTDRNLMRERMNFAL